MDVGGTSERMAVYLRDHQDKVVGRWSELVLAGVRGRTALDELRRELTHQALQRFRSGSHR